MSRQPVADCLKTSRFKRPIMPKGRPRKRPQESEDGEALATLDQNAAEDQIGKSIKAKDTASGPKSVKAKKKVTMKTILPKNRWRRNLKWAASTEALPRSPSSTALPDKSSRGWRMSTLIISHPHSLRLKRLPILKSQEEELLTSGNYKLIFASSIIIFFMICISYFIVLLSTTDPQLKFGMGNLRVLQES